jgi:hypothetical protein
MREQTKSKDSRKILGLVRQKIVHKSLKHKRTNTYQKNGFAKNSFLPTTDNYSAVYTEDYAQFPSHIVERAPRIVTITVTIIKTEAELPKSIY